MAHLFEHDRARTFESEEDPANIMCSGINSTADIKRQRMFHDEAHNLWLGMASTSTRSPAIEFERRNEEARRH